MNSKTIDQKTKEFDQVTINLIEEFEAQLASVQKTDPTEVLNSYLKICANLCEKAVAHKGKLNDLVQEIIQSEKYKRS